MGKPLSAQARRRAKVHEGPHLLCYRCDSFEKNYDGTCELCGLDDDRMAPCIREWCPFCTGSVPEQAYLDRCSARAPREGETIREPIVGPLAKPSWP